MRPLPFLATLAVSSFVVGRALSQCTATWVGGDGVPGLVGSAQTLQWWDPDGSGPMPRRLVIGGFFALAGTAPASNIVAYDPATGSWSALGAGLNNQVDALAVLPNGTLVAGGSFTASGSTPMRGLAFWDGVQWQALGDIAVGAVSALAVLPNGDLVAGGGFANVAGVPALNLARWNGTSWSAFGSGTDAPVLALAVAPTGDLFAGGAFTTIDGAAAVRIARWNGVAWSALGAGITDPLGAVYALAPLPGGGVVAGGTFLAAGGQPANRVASWSGSAWQALGSGTSAAVFALAAQPNGDLLVGGAFDQAGGQTVNSVARWNGSLWSGFGSGITGFVAVGNVFRIAADANGDVYVGGGFRAAGGLPALSLARLAGNAWSALGTGITGAIWTMLRRASGAIVAAGDFEQLGGVPARRIGEWNGTAWQAFGGGLSGFIENLAERSDGALVASSLTTSTTGVQSTDVVLWNGSGWQVIGTFPRVVALVGLPGGELVATVHPQFSNAWSLQRWDGVAWAPLPLPGPVGLNWGRLLADKNGDLLLVGGEVTLPSGFTNFLRWNGTTWQALPAAPTGVSTALLARDGSVLVGVQFSISSPVLRWDGISWSFLGSFVDGAATLCELPGGDLLITSTIARGTLRRWNGMSWTTLTPSLIGLPLLPPLNVAGMALGLDGRVLLGGSFGVLPGIGASAFVARVATSCPAGGQNLGGGCPSSGGANTLTGGLAWIGDTWRARGDGLPAVALVARVTGFTPITLPLTNVFATALPGCTLRTAADLVDLTLQFGGVCESAIPLPSDPALLGGTFMHQLVSIDAAGFVVTATDALQRTVGGW